MSAHEVKGIEEVDGSLSVAVAPAGNGESSTIPADEVVLCLGISPNVSLGEQAGLQLDAERGGLLVDAELKTSFPDVFAAGDVASYTDMILGQTRSEVGPRRSGFHVGSRMLTSRTPSLAPRQRGNDGTGSGTKHVRHTAQVHLPAFLLDRSRTECRP